MDNDFLISIAKGQIKTAHLSRKEAVKRLGAFNNKQVIQALIELLDDEELAEQAYKQLSKSVYLFNNYYEVVKKHQHQNTWATRLLESWSKKVWLTNTPAIPESFDTIVFKVPGIVTAEVLSPVKAAWSRKNISMHAASMLSELMPDAIMQIQGLKAKGYPILFVADQIDTRTARGLHRKSAVQSLLWHLGKIGNVLSDQILRGMLFSQHVDNDFYELAENRGILILEGKTDLLDTGECITIWPNRHEITFKNGQIASFQTKRKEWKEIWRMGSRIAYSLGNTLTHQASKHLIKEAVITSESNCDKVPIATGYTLAQKIIGAACKTRGVKPGTYCELMTSIVTLPTLGLDTHEKLDFMSDTEYAADLVIGYKEAILPNENSVTLKPNDGKTHAWLHRLLLPDSVNMSHDGGIRSALGISLHLPNQVEWAAVTGSASMVMPSSVLVRFRGKPGFGIRLRDLIHAIYYLGLEEDAWHKTPHILEIEGLKDLSAEAAYEFTQSSESYNFAGCVIQLDLNRVKKTIEKNTKWLQHCLENKYKNHQGLTRRLLELQYWLENPSLLKPDINAVYQKKFEISLENLHEPLLATIQDPKKIAPLSEMAKQLIPIDEVWIGPTAIHLDHYRVVAQLLKKHSKPLKARLWVMPPSPFELKQLIQEGCYQIYGQAGVYTEMPSNEVCTQTRFQSNVRMVTTSLDAFSKEQFKLLEGYITSPELATITAILGRLPTFSEYHSMLE